ncbi:hypothetical protein D3C79_1078960 [compost metagenome]
MQQCDSLIFTCIGTELQVDVPEHLPGESIQRFGFAPLQPTALAKCAQPSARAAVIEQIDQQSQCLLGPLW